MLHPFNYRVRHPVFSVQPPHTSALLSCSVREQFDPSPARPRSAICSLPRAPKDADLLPDPAAFRRWLARHHADATELWVGLYKKDSRKPSITWPESVDEALCVGWIDGIRKSLGNDSYMIRFTPRKARSTWSLVNVFRATALLDEGRMLPAGRAPPA